MHDAVSSEKGYSRNLRCGRIVAVKIIMMRVCKRTCQDVSGESSGWRVRERVRNEDGVRIDVAVLT